MLKHGRSFSFRVIWKRRIKKPTLRLLGDGWALDTDLTEPESEQRQTHHRHWSAWAITVAASD
jgi:hypothetical protein